MNQATKFISFDDTATAFAHKSPKELKKSRWLFSTMSHPLLVKLGTRITPWIIKAGLPVKGLIRSTIFDQFVGGETLDETASVGKKLGESNVKVILDYGVEGKEGEESFDHGCEEFINVINYAATQPNMPFMSIKVTGLARFSLLEKLDAASANLDGVEGRIATQVLNKDEENEWQRVVGRMQRIVEAAAARKIGVLVDAEETWIQDPVDALTMQMMQEFNRETAVIYNTVQLYRHDRLQFLKDSFYQSQKNNFNLGVKLVRGAYMEKERKRAVAMNYTSPIQSSKEATDNDYNDAIRFCTEHLQNIFFIVASHNEYSNLLTTELLQQMGLPLDHSHVHFSQLYGMSDNITFNLAKAGCLVSKYLPFGPIKDVVPYLMRRAQENSSVKGQTGRELGLITKEMKRRSGL